MRFIVGKYVLDQLTEGFIFDTPLSLATTSGVQAQPSTMIKRQLESTISDNHPSWKSIGQTTDDRENIQYHSVLLRTRS